MATFLTNLWESVFTPGPTPTLLIAANASFGALQLVLLALFLATYSAHFIALSLICAGVWWGINWFAVELHKAQLAEEEAARIRKERRKASGLGGDGTAETSGGEGGDEDEDEQGGDTETETEKDIPQPGPRMVGGVRLRGGPEKIKGVLASAGYDISSLENKNQGETSGSQKLEPPATLQKRKSGGSSSADLSVSGTDSEWEKVSEHGK